MENVGGRVGRGDIWRVMVAKRGDIYDIVI